jgi:hypothetical protein
MYGLPAIKLSAITDSYYYSSESMVAGYQKSFKEFCQAEISEIH